MLRGQYDKPGEKVQPGVPAVLPPLKLADPTDRPTRLDFLLIILMMRILLVEDERRVARQELRDLVHRRRAILTARIAAEPTRSECVKLRCRGLTAAAAVATS